MSNKELIKELRAGKSTKSLFRRAAAALEALECSQSESADARTRRKLVEALEKPVVRNREDQTPDSVFEPWRDIAGGICGSYSFQSDAYMIITLKAVQDGQAFKAIREYGFIVEFMLYVLAGLDLIDYGTSPRGGWVNSEIADLWPTLIEKWEAYSKERWEVK